MNTWVCARDCVVAVSVLSALQSPGTVLVQSLNHQNFNRYIRLPWDSLTRLPIRFPTQKTNLLAWSLLYTIFEASLNKYKIAYLIMPLVSTRMQLPHATSPSRNAKSFALCKSIGSISHTESWAFSGDGRWRDQLNVIMQIVWLLATLGIYEVLLPYRSPQMAQSPRHYNHPTLNKEASLVQYLRRWADWLLLQSTDSMHESKCVTVGWIRLNYKPSSLHRAHERSGIHCHADSASSNAQSLFKL